MKSKENTQELPPKFDLNSQFFQINNSLVQELLDLPEIYPTIDRETHTFLNPDRVKSYQFYPDSSGEVSAEAMVLEDTPIAPYITAEAIASSAQLYIYGQATMSEIAQGIFGSPIGYTSKEGKQVATPNSTKLFKAPFSCPPISNNRVYYPYEIAEYPLPWSNEITFTPSLASHLPMAVMQKRMVGAIQHLAYRDPLTGLPNRRQLSERLSSALANNVGDRQEILMVAILDLDRFKTINDSLGSTAGDCLLQSVAQRLASCVREIDTIARWGGDEFILLLPQIANLEDAGKITQRILDKFQAPFIFNNQEFHITFSMGIALAPDNGTETETILKNADIALSRVKQQGRNNYLFYTPTMNIKSLDQLVLQNSLYKAIDRKEFLLHYQPQIDLNTGQIVGMEALIRWQHPDLGFIPPDQFIPLAEETGLICQIGEWVLRTACAQNRAWQLAGLAPMAIAVNLSVHQVQQANLVKTITQILQETNLDPRYLEIEITETTAIQNIDSTISVLQELQDLGIQIAMDDFGTGYSSLGLLKRFPFHKLKIDRSFISELATNENDAAIVTAIVALGHGLNLEIIAEGVETSQQLELLRALKCNVIQGYLFSRPLAAEAATQFCLDRTACKYSPQQGRQQHKLPLAANEPQRLQALYKYQILDTEPEDSFDELTCLAAHICQTPIASIGLIDSHRQWFKSKVGLIIPERPRTVALCNYTISQKEILIVRDTWVDLGVETNSLGNCYPRTRFYTGVPLISPDGFALGTLFVMDYVPRDLTMQQQQALQHLARQVITALELRQNLLERQHIEQLRLHVEEVEQSKQDLEQKVTALQWVETALRQQIERERLVKDIAVKIRQSLNLEEILQTTVAQVRQFLNADRVTIYRLWSDGTGSGITEATSTGLPTLLGQTFPAEVLPQEYRKLYCMGRIRAIADVDKAHLTPCLVNFLHQLGVRAKLVVPILNQDELWGLLIAHQSEPRQWKQFEIELLSQIATQAGIAIQQSKLYQELQHIADADCLTQIANRRRFDEYLNQAWQQQRRGGGYLALIMGDIDFFKSYNDSYGHQAGDDCLQRVAKALCLAVNRSTDLVARYGGEEFALILPHTDAEGAIQIAEQIRSQIQGLQIAHPTPVSNYVTFSLGVASIIPDLESSPEALIAAADRALYRAKTQGRDRVYCEL